MKDTIYLTISKSGVKKMTKNFNGAKKNQIVAKLKVEVEDDAFNPPVIEKQVFIEDWRDGIDIEDVKFDERYITEEEAEMIRQKRLDKMRRILESQGYTVEEIEEELSEDEL